MTTMDLQWRAVAVGTEHTLVVGELSLFAFGLVGVSTFLVSVNNVR